MLDRELVEAVKLAREAGAVLLEVYATDFDVEYKEPSEPVTVADKRANELIVARLRDTFPDDVVISEESTENQTAPLTGRCWYVDPLDGTKEFIARNGEFAVMIGLAIDGRARLGVVYQPEGNILYRGVVGESAFVERGERTYALRVSETPEPSELRLVSSRSHRSKAMGGLMEQLGVTEEIRSGSVGLKCGLIARRDADLYVNLSSKTMAWDACAPEAVLRAAGGRFADLAGEPFRYGGDLRNLWGILACNGAAFEAVVPAVREAAAAKGLLPLPPKEGAEA
ncbi:MAG: 3'(2'),5'-bisphosphate nucleotidase CysQ [Sandaracinaceae bacterium]